MFRQKCIQCERIGWFWERGWFRESQADAEKSEERVFEDNPSYRQLNQMLDNVGIVPREAADRCHYCPDCAPRRRLEAIIDGSASFDLKSVVPGPELCSKCGCKVKKSLAAKPLWYDADQVNWCCVKCVVIYCGTCCTAQLQQLQQKYKASGAALKRAIDNDDSALYMKGELDPECPKCRKTLIRNGFALVK